MKLVTYSCVSCRNCFQRKDQGVRVPNICPNGGGTDSIRMDIKNSEIVKGKLGKLNKSK